MENDKLCKSSQEDILNALHNSDRNGINRNDRDANTKTTTTAASTSSNIKQLIRSCHLLHQHNNDLHSRDIAIEEMGGGGSGGTGGSSNSSMCDTEDETSSVFGKKANTGVTATSQAHNIPYMQLFHHLKQKFPDLKDCDINESIQKVRFNRCLNINKV